jgi:hypothetical protein
MNTVGLVTFRQRLKLPYSDFMTSEGALVAYIALASGSVSEKKT